MTAQELITAGYFQVSYRHREVARLPTGETGVQALARAAKEQGTPPAGEWSRLESQAGDQYLRVYAAREGNVLKLDRETFKEFRQLGGCVYGHATQHQGTDKEGT